MISRPRFEKGSSLIQVHSATAEPAWSGNIPYYMPPVVSELCKIQSKPVTVSTQITVSWDLTPSSLVIPVGVVGVGKRYKTTRRNNTGDSNFNERKLSVTRQLKQQQKSSVIINQYLSLINNCQISYRSVTNLSFRFRYPGQTAFSTTSWLSRAQAAGIIKYRIVLWDTQFVSLMNCIICTV